MNSIGVDRPIVVPSLGGFAAECESGACLSLRSDRIVLWLSVNLVVGHLFAASPQN